VRAAQAGVAEAKANATAQEKAAEETLSAAKARLSLLKKGARPEDVRAAELQVAQAKNSLAAAKINRDGVCGTAALPKYLCDSANARVAAAQNAVDIANNNLARVRKGPLPDEVRVAEAAVRQAQAGLDAARATKAPATNAANSAVQSATARLRQLEGGATAEELAIAKAGLDQAIRNLADLQAIQSNPLAANAQIDVAAGQHEAAKAAVEGAEARLDSLKNGPTEEQIAVAEAQVGQAEAAVLVLRSQIEKLRIASPAAGQVSERSVGLGDVVGPSASILGVVALDPVKLTVYVPEPLVGRVRVGQVAELTVDPYPGEVFRGEVSYIAPRAEFTPRNVTTQKDRATTVFAVRVRIPNADGRLKPGLAADAKLLAQ
jgi:multidrug resistance efflux pump